MQKVMMSTKRNGFQVSAIICLIFKSLIRRLLILKAQTNKVLCSFLFIVWVLLSLKIVHSYFQEKLLNENLRKISRFHHYDTYLLLLNCNIDSYFDILYIFKISMQRNRFSLIFYIIFYTILTPPSNKLYTLKVYI